MVLVQIKIMEAKKSNAHHYCRLDGLTSFACRFSSFIKNLFNQVAEAMNVTLCDPYQNEKDK
jgi:hypothetical protein